jgi:predicted phosphodiesterase
MPKTITTLCIGDSHFPFHNRKTVGAIISLCRKLKPQVIIQLGDLLDLYSYSRFARSQNIMTPAQEVKRGRKDAELMWKELRQASPKADCFQILGNHDARFAKQVLDKLPEAEHLLKGVYELWKFDGVITSNSDRDELILDGVCYQHGYRKFGEHARSNGMSTVCGHLHRGGVQYSRLGNKTIWELNAGFCADENSIPMSYSKQRRFSQHTQGCGVIDEYGPRFIPL